MTEKALREGWQTVKFGEIARHISKRVEPSETELEIYVGLEHLDPDSLKIKRHGVPSDVAGQKLLVKKGQIIFGKRRAYQRKVAVADWDCICSAHAMVLEAIPGKILPEFLPFFMQSDVFMNRAVAISEGSLSPTIKWKTLELQEFFLPNKSHQRKLIEVCVKSLAALSEINSTAMRLEQLCGALAKEKILGGNDFVSLFGESETLLPSGWSLVTLGDVLERVQYGTSDAIYEKGTVPVLRMMNIEHGKITNTDLKYSKLSISELQDIKLNHGDILFNRTNSMDLVGKTGIFCLDGDYVFASYMLRLNVKENIVTSKFVNRYLNLPLVQYRLKAFATPSVSQANINPTSLKSMPFLLPPMKDIEEADRVFDDLDKYSEELNRERERVFRLEKTIKENILGA